MGKGFLKVETTAAFEALPVAGADIHIKEETGESLYRAVTDQNGVTETVALSAPHAAHTMSPEDAGPRYAVYTVEVNAPGYEPVVVRGVQAFDGQTSVLPVEMHPQARGIGAPREIVIPENDLEAPAVWLQQGPLEEGLARLAREVVVPEQITVHLGAPTANVRNVRIGFADYIKNVASSEIYPTWPQAALEANIYCQISFALNRVYTEWYHSRGYGFHITSSTSFDQSFVEGRNIFANISDIVDNIFNVFVRRRGYGEPYFTQYCNGTTVTCRGLSQWGTVPLANQGRNAYQILLSYYPSDIQLVATQNIQGIPESYPGTPLRQGSTGQAVRRMQSYLNRIRVNYPLIPSIANPNGVFGADTAAAVRVFQQTFNLTADGIIGKATWYKIISIYTGVKKLADLDSEGERIGLGETPPTSVLRQGSRGGDVVQLQFLLNYMAEFYSDLPTVIEDSVFGAGTKAAVIAFQGKFALSADGVVGPATWQKLYQVYGAIESTVTPPTDPGGGTTPPAPSDPAYPGTLLRNGSRGEDVRLVQRYLNAIFGFCPGYTPLGEDGIFGPATQAGVTALQRASDLSPDGIVGPLTWEAMVAAYNRTV